MKARNRIEDISLKEWFSCKTCLIKDIIGTLLIEDNDVKERWLHHTKELLDDPCRSDFKHFKFIETLSGPPVLKEQVCWARKKARKSKASRRGGTPIETIKPLEELGLD